MRDVHRKVAIERRATETKRESVKVGGKEG